MEIDHYQQRKARQLTIFSEEGILSVLHASCYKQSIIQACAEIIFIGFINDSRYRTRNSQLMLEGCMHVGNAVVFEYLVVVIDEPGLPLLWLRSLVCLFNEAASIELGHSLHSLHSNICQKFTDSLPRYSMRNANAICYIIDKYRDTV